MEIFIESFADNFFDWFVIQVFKMWYDLMKYSVEFKGSKIF